MAIWQVQQAKMRLSEVIEKACQDGPQFITKHGAERAVVLSISAYRTLTAHQPSLKDYLLDGPKFDEIEIEREPDGDRSVEL